ncbi:MAG: type I glyceraldehyde-3-phosphate dehydrogenase, partial [Candidatus Nomurabacteria bacterium]|nr:type I glyceraldehyde-3-phosphate dehydrogenase [Candidatus Nomurabacteria bacterium]
PEVSAHLLQYDSVYGEFGQKVSFDDESLTVGNQKIKFTSIREAENLPWAELGVDIVLECTGVFTDPAKAMAHLSAGAKKVILSAPAKGDGATTIVLGVNDDDIATAKDIISCASCTTNCIAPVMSLLCANFSVKKAMMNTIHSYTGDQVLLDGFHKDPRRARSAAINIVPTSTGASIAAAEVIPALKDKFGGTSYRVPTPTVSICDIVVVVEKPTTVEEINKVFETAAKQPYYQGLLDATRQPLVSTDFIGNSYSAIIDLELTQVVDGDLVKVVAWYDNEWGYSNRLVELTADVGKALK